LLLNDYPIGASAPRALSGPEHAWTKIALVTRAFLDLIGEYVESQRQFTVEWCLGRQAVQFDNVVLNQSQPLDIASHVGRLQPTLRFSADILPRLSLSS
jgi:hypothetical protein